MIVHCQHCDGVVLKDVKLEGVGAMVFQGKMKCPHCNAPTTIRIVAAVEQKIFVDEREILPDHTSPLSPTPRVRTL